LKKEIVKIVLSFLISFILFTTFAWAEEETDDSTLKKVGKEVAKVGEKVSKGATQIGKEAGKGALKVGKEVGEAGVDVSKGVGKGVKAVGEETLDIIKKGKELFFDPIIVSATRLPSVKTRLSNNPANTTIITADDINATGARTIQEALQYIEGVNIYDQVGNNVDTTFNLRGFTDNEETAVIVDGVRVNEVDLNIFNPNLLNINNIEQIEVVRGTASPMFGDSALGGVLNITTKQPSEELFSPFGMYEFGSFRYQNFNAGASGTVQDKFIFGIPGRIKYFFSGARQLYGGYRDNGDTRGTFFDGKLGYELEDETGEVMFYIKYTDQENHNPGELTLFQEEANRQQTAKPLDNRKWENLILSVNANKSFFADHIDLSLNAYRRLTDIDFTSTSVVFGQTKQFFTLSTQKGLVGQVTYNEELGPLQNQATLGVEYANGSDNDESIVRIGFGAGTVTDNSTDKDDTGFYFQDVLTIYEKLILTFGLRHDEVDYRFDNRTNVTLADFDETTARVGGVIKPCKYLDLFASFSEAFKAPGKSDLFDTTGWGGNDPTLKPEKADSYEIGVRTRWEDKISANVTWFHITTNDEILFDPNTFASANIGRTRRYGLETSVRVHPIDFFDAYFTHTFTDAKVRKTRPVFGGIVDSGRELGLVPESRFTAGVHLGPISGFNLWLDSIFVGRQHTQSAETMGGNLDPIEPYYVFNGKLSFMYKGAEIYCKVNNIFDREYFTRGIYSGGDFYLTPAPEREIIGGIRFAWGE